MDYTKQIFEMLGVEPEEEFKLTTHNPNYRDGIYSNLIKI